MILKHCCRQICSALQQGDATWTTKKNNNKTNKKNIKKKTYNISSIKKSAAFSCKVSFCWRFAFSCKTWAGINVPLLFLHFAAKRLMVRLASSSWVNTSEGPCWLLHAVTWEWGELGRADSVNLNATEAALSQRQPFDLFRDTIWPSWLCAGKDAGGAATWQPTFSRRSFSVIFLNSAWCEWGRKWAFTLASKPWSN